MSKVIDGMVVDASVAVKWHLIDEDYAEQADLLLRHFTEKTVTLVAPDHIRYEVPSAITAATLGKSPRISREDGGEAIQEFFDLGLRTVTSNDHIISAYLLGHEYGCSFYDALYLATARSLNLPFITADRKLYRKIAHLPDIIWLGDYGTAPKRSSGAHER